ncbi:MAG TPA: leucine-rich repeat domain-containing protein [Candidatus Babeliaceae bacterium]|nr:leucine-rich repeat domain-containing protein [Candidatus Babeliaceae bacterium]
MDGFEHIEHDYQGKPSVASDSQLHPQISHIKDIFSKLVAFNIAAKTLNQQGITDLSKAHLSDLQALDLSGKQLKDLHKDCAQLLQIIGFSFAIRGIAYQEKAVVELEKEVTLKTLNLSNNHLTIIPNDFFELTSLEELDLSKNCLTTISNKIAQLKNLKNLNISYNQINQIPRKIAHLIHLRALNLENNDCTDLPDEITTLTNLQTLNIRENSRLNLSLDLRAKLLGLPNIDTACFPW